MSYCNERTTKALRGGGHKVYRRLGYRVVIETWPREQLRWAVYRPRLHTAAASGIAANVDGAVSTANAWIGGDVRAHGLK